MDIRPDGANDTLIVALARQQGKTVEPHELMVAAWKGDTLKGRD
jgi:hypothetical protein